MMDFRNIHNYYEHLVLEYMRENMTDDLGDKNSDFLLDVACYALSKLPARYMRHEIDMAFYLKPDERKSMEDNVKKAVVEACKYISRNFNKDDRYTIEADVEPEPDVETEESMRKDP